MHQRTTNFDQLKLKLTITQQIYPRGDAKLTQVWLHNAHWLNSDKKKETYHFIITMSFPIPHHRSEVIKTHRC